MWCSTSGEVMTVHVANPGAMTGLDRPFRGSGCPIPAIRCGNFRYTWELVETDLGSGPELVGVNTGQPHQLVAEALGGRPDSGVARLPDQSGAR